MQLPRPHNDPRLAELDRILSSPAFSGPGRLARFLRFVVEQTVAGRGDEIKEYLIALEVYDKPDSFDPKIDSTVRSEATKLRSRLAAYYESEGRANPLVISIPRGTYVPVFEPRRVVEFPAREEPKAEPALVPVARPSRRPRWWLAGGLALVLACGGWLLSRRGPGGAGSPRIPEKLTTDLALNVAPALSSDGRLLAFASTRAGRGDLDIWIQEPRVGADPRRLTAWPEDETEPGLSPDGATLAFRAERDGGGIWVMPTAPGGEPRLFAREGRRPRFSPDGQRIAYFVGDARLGDNAVSGGLRAYAASVNGGGSPVRIAPEFEVVTHPVWLPDGRVLFRGYQGADSAGVKFDWFVTSLEPGAAVIATGFKAQLERQAMCGIWNSFSPGVWVRDGVIFAASCKGANDLWKIPISLHTGKVTGAAAPVTVGSESSASPSADAAGRIVYASLTGSSEIWSAPLDGKGEWTRHTFSTVGEQYPSITSDGSSLVYMAPRGGNPDVMLRDLRTGRETAVAEGAPAQTYPTISPDDKWVRWVELKPDPSDPVGYNHIAWERPLAGGDARKICEHCAEMGPGPDGRSHLDLDGRPVGIVLRDEGGKYSQYVWHPRRDVMMAAPSPGRKWMAFQARHEDDRLHLYTAAFTLPAGEWIEWGEGQMPVWSRDGAVLYFVSRRDGHACVWGRGSKDGRPEGEPFAVAHVHGAGRQLGPGSPVFPWISVSRDRVVFALTERGGNLFLLRD